MTKEIDCKRCSFMIRSENEDELVSFVQQHNRNMHNWETSKEELRRAAKEV